MAIGTPQRPTPWQSRTWAGCLLLALAAAVSPSGVRALANQPVVGIQPPQLSLDWGGDVGPEVPERPPRESTVGPSGTLGLGQTAIPGTTIAIVADHVKLFDTDPYCDTYYQPLQPDGTLCVRTAILLWVLEPLE